ncbi:MAG TPA: inositol monophosphatase family protein [Polyangiaceae bacterium]|nr:inositol monophosphatase family protein [Polyangiaceae bacterium]
MAIAHERFIEVFRLAALQAGAVARYLQGKVGRERKAGQGSPEAEALTAVDLATQDVILHQLRAHLPDVAVDAEEDTPLVDAFDPPAHDRSLVVIDPIDGTLNYSRGSRDYAVMGALIEDGLYRAAVIYFPEYEALYAAARGGGATVERAGERARAVRVADLPDRVLVSPRVGDGAERRLSRHATEIVVSRCSAVDASAPVLGRAKAAVSEARADRRRAIGFLITEEAGGFTLFGDLPWEGRDPELLPADAGPTITAADPQLAWSIREALRY